MWIIPLLPAQPNQRQFDMRFAHRFSTIEGTKKKPINAKVVSKQISIACHRTPRSFLSCVIVDCIM
uniref:Uncharacterized protein n=1 Tax=Romanomermis culicivorax TaxID=13658 RepID=A0A915ISN0_ROMCU